MYAELDCPWDWARVGIIWFGSGLDVLIRVDDPAEEPCFHIVDYRAGKFDISVSLTEPKCLRPYAEARLTDEAKQALGEFMHGIPKQRYFETHYEQAVFLWNDQNPHGAQVTIAKDANGNVIIPDYSALN